MHSELPSDHTHQTVSDAEAQRLLARAVEIEAELGGQTSLARVREIAVEAGISDAALVRALQELRDRTALPVASPPLSLGERLRQRFLPARVLASTSPEPLVPNLLAGAGFWVSAFLFAQIGHLFGPIGVETSTAATAFVAALLARKFGARFVSLGLLGIATFQVAELVMHARYGIESVQGGPTHWAVLIAGILGVALGARFGRADAPPAVAPVLENAVALGAQSSDVSEEKDRGAPAKFVWRTLTPRGAS